MTDEPKRRLKKPMSVREFAKATGLSPATAHRVLHGDKITVENARKAVPFLEECPCCGGTDATLRTLKAKIKAMHAGLPYFGVPHIREGLEDMLDVIGKIGDENDG